MHSDASLSTFASLAWFRPNMLKKELCDYSSQIIIPAPALQNPVDKNIQVKVGCNHSVLTTFLPPPFFPTEPYSDVPHKR